MLRWLLVLAGAIAISAIDASPLFAAGNTAWPALSSPFSRGNGAYLSPWKILIAWVLFLTWVRTSDWISQDAQAMKLKYAMWNPIVFFSFFLFFLLFWLLPVFAVGILLLLIAYLAPLISYIVYRNGRVQSYQKVLTAKHIRRMIAVRVNKIGIKMEGGEADPRELGPPITLIPMGGGNERDNNVNLLTARQSPGWTAARELLDEALLQRATHIMMDFTAESVGIRYQIDGVWHDRAPMERATGDFILAIFKGLAALNINDRRARQSGSFGMEMVKDKYTCKITSQGTQTGERALVHIEPKKLLFKTLDEIGMRAKMQEQLALVMQQPGGMLLISAMPGGGMSVTMDLVLTTTDRFTRNFVSVVEASKSEREIENLHVTTFSNAAGETAATVLPKLIRTYPDVIVVQDVPDLDTMSILCEQVGEKRLILTCMRAKEAVEALLRVLMLKVPASEFAPVVTAVLNVRLVRKLCEKCKEGYPPPAEVLKQLGLPAGRVEALYRPPTEPVDPKHPDAVCDQCEGVGYFGRTGIFELLIVEEDMRQALVSSPKLETMRLLARKVKHRSLQEEGVLLVARGITSIQELLRVLKQ